MIEITKKVDLSACSINLKDFEYNLECEDLEKEIYRVVEYQCEESIKIMLGYKLYDPRVKEDQRRSEITEVVKSIYGELLKRDLEELKSYLKSKIDDKSS